eukprot:1156212-Pelagomonas_calceolata.AAC.2
MGCAVGQVNMRTVQASGLPSCPFISRLVPGSDNSSLSRQFDILIAQLRLRGKKKKADKMCTWQRGVTLRCFQSKQRTEGFGVSLFVEGEVQCPGNNDACIGCTMYNQQFSSESGTKTATCLEHTETPGTHEKGQRSMLDETD